MADPIPTQPASKTITSPGGKKRRRGGSRIFNFLLLIGIIVAIALFVNAEMQRRAADTQLQQTQKELDDARKLGTNAGGEEVTKAILDKARQHIDIPNDPAPTVATIVDVDKLKSANEFYKNAQNGDHLIITATRAILFRAEDNNGAGRIIDVVPVVIDPNASAAPTPIGQTPAPAAATSTKLGTSPAPVTATTAPAPATH